MGKYLRLIHKPTRKVISTGEFGKSLILFKDHIFTSDISSNFHLVPLSSGASFFNGIGKFQKLMWQDREVFPKLFQTSVPNPLFLFTNGKVAFPKEHPDIYLEFFDDKDKLSYSEEEIYEDNERIKKVIKKIKLIDKRSDESSFLYKDKETERVWQLSYDNPKEKENTNLRLTAVTYPQWTFEYIEQRELKRRGENPIDPEEFMDMMQEDPRGGVCDNEECDRPKAKFTPLCRHCHYEIIMGHPFSN